MKLILALAFQLALLPLTYPAAAAQIPSSTEQQPVDFTKQIAPIIRSRCVQCHNSEQIAGGLNLESRKSAAQGGDTGLGILTIDDGSNELLSRIRSDEASYRMPKGLPALEKRQIELVAQWIAEGADWPAPMDAEQPQSLVIRIADFADTIDERTQIIPNRAIFAGAAFGILLIVLIIEKAKERVDAASHEGSPREPFVTRIHWGYYLIMSFAWVTVLAFSVHRAQQDELHMQIKNLNSDVASMRRSLSRYTGDGSVTDIFGNPPVPHRQDHEPALAHTYYRGNDERNPELFNNGNYRTAEFTIALQDQSGTAMKHGSNVIDRDLNIRFDIKRAPGTTDSLFSEAIIDSVLVTNEYCEFEGEPGKNPVLRMSTDEPDWKWTIEIPIGQLKRNDRIKGLYYIYTGRITDTFRAKPYYAISYSLATEGGRLNLQSEIWMGSLFLNGLLFPPPVQRVVPPNRIPYEEFFSYEPIPAISGPNTTDPKLLGIPEHVQESKSTP